MAVAETTTAEALQAAPRTTLTLPAGAAPRPVQQQTGEVLAFELDRSELPRFHFTSDADAAEARRIAAHRREQESRARVLEYLKRLEAGDMVGADGAMLARPHRDVLLGFVSAEALEASLARSFGQQHLIDRMWDAGQLSDWMYAAASRALELAVDAGLLDSKTAGLGRSGAGHADMSNGMAQARARWNRLMREIGYPGDELVTGLCQGENRVHGQAARAHALKEALRHMAEHWGIEIC